MWIAIPSIGHMHDGRMANFGPDYRKVRIWGDTDAAESEYTKNRYSNPYHYRMQHFMGTGYNHYHGHIAVGM